jgi:peptidoglycan/xylan/chitin deacetylase (PgdA/CDA1 family)
MPKVTLTFDNGPEAKTTSDVLDCLTANQVAATFFVIGYKVATPQGAALVRRASEQGHRIGNHTFSHTRPLGELDRRNALLEFDRAESALSWLDQPRPLFRPYGRAGKLGNHLLHPAVVERLQAGGYTCVLWNSVPGDWRDPMGWVERAIDDCRSRPWSLVVLHDTPTGAMSHLDRFIQGLRREGMAFTQEYPPECLPIVEGKIAGPIDQYVGESPN